MIDTWEIETVYLTHPDGEVEVMGEGSYYDRESFLTRVDQLSIGKYYLLGFGREYLCRVDNFDVMVGEIWLTLILEISEHQIELEKTDDSSKYLLTIKYSDLPEKV